MLGRPQILLLALAAAATAAVIALVDLTPQVEGDFFFSRDDPQMQRSEAIEARYPAGQQLIVRVAGRDLRDPDYRAGVAALGDSLRTVPGVTAVTSLADEDAFGSPLWRRALLAGDSSASNLIVDLRTDSVDALVREVERITGAMSRPGLEMVVSGVPFVVELIRRNLFRDLVVFSSAALVVFGVAVAAVYRRVPIVAGTLATCLTACALTLTLTTLMGMAIGLLTANLVTIVFVLTLSHIVFLTSNWSRRARAGAHDPVREAVRETATASFWCMVTTLLGFASLLLATAKPLRELGIAGAAGTATAIVVTYLMYPVFLRGTRPVPAPGDSRAAGWLPRPGRRLTWLAGIGVVGVVMAAGVFRLSTDPSLLSYFAAGSPIRAGLEAVDRDGGSSPLSVVFRDPSGARLDQDATVAKMWRLQEALESDPAVGVVLSPALILEDVRRRPFMGRLTWEQILNIPLVSRLAAGFIRGDRAEGLYLLRMRESDRTESRAAIVRRIDGTVREQGLEPVLVGGLFELQGQLGALIASSLRIGLGGLLSLFLLIGLVVSRSPVVAGWMVLCLMVVPACVLGAFGYSGTAVDIITSPSANVALAMGVDSMIHVVVRVRRLMSGGVEPPDAWLAARSQLASPVLGAALIIGAGFGIFALSSFPPTQRFGIAVILGTATAAVMALVALPLGAAGGGRTVGR